MIVVSVHFSEYLLSTSYRTVLSVSVNVRQDLYILGSNVLLHIPVCVKDGRTPTVDSLVLKLSTNSLFCVCSPF